MKNSVIYIFFFLIIFSSCTDSEKKDGTRTPYLEVNGSYLYVEDVQSLIPEDATAEDSLLIAKDYEKKWITDVLMYKYASKNISNMDEINKLVRDYKKSLIIHQYIENITQERLANVISEDMMLQYYEENMDKFRLNSIIIKGVFIQLPLGVPKYSKLKRWLRNYDDKSIEKVEKYCIQNATTYQYFGENWLLYQDITQKIPQIAVGDNSISKNRFVEVKDSSYYYILHVLDVKYKGEVEPFEFSRDKIHKILMNKERIKFINNFHEKIYKNAVREEDITYYIKEEKE